MDSDQAKKCRGCLTEEDKMHDIFTTFNGNLSLADILYENSVKIEESDARYLCVKCTTIICDFYNFKLQFLISQKHFVSSSVNTSEYQSDQISLICNESDILQNNLKISFDAPNNITSNCNDMCGSNFCTTEMKTEIEEFTVENEIVQLIERDVYFCNCGKEFISKEKFCNHMEINHGSDNINLHNFCKKILIKVPLGKITEENYEYEEKDNCKRCKMCKKVISINDFNYHMDGHKKYICNCGSKFLHYRDLITHRKCKHSDERNYVCQFCNKAFKIKQVLDKHLRLHTHPLEQICDICGSRFNTKSVLKTHMKLKHFPSKDFQCYLCGLNFPLKSTLEKHIKTHDPIRQKMHSCDLCNMTYTEKSSLNRHIAVKHTQQYSKSTCDQCGKSFTTKGNLYKHIRVVHEKNVKCINSADNI